MGKKQKNNNLVCAELHSADPHISTKRIWSRCGLKWPPHQLIPTDTPHKLRCVSVGAACVLPRLYHIEGVHQADLNQT